MASDTDSSIDEQTPTGGVWALPMLALGMGLIACCLIIPAADDTRRVMYERERLRAEMQGLERQVALNDEFLQRIHTDRELALRLAARQRTEPEEGVAILSPTWSRPGAGGLGNFAMSPFALVAAEPVLKPAGPTPAQGGQLAAYCRHPRTRLAVLGTGLLFCMLGLLGGGGQGNASQRSRRPRRLR